MAIDAVCDAARRIIGRLGEGAGGGAALALGDTSGGYSGKDRPPTAGMKRFAVSIARRKGIDPPKGYTKSAAVCRAFLELHAPERTTGSAERNGAAGTRPPSAAQVSYAEALARERDITVPDEARACSAAMSKWIDANKPAKPATGRRAPAHKSRDQAAKGKTAQARAQRRRKPGDAAEGAAPPAGARAEAPAGKPLRIPYGNKEAAFALGARYASGRLVCAARRRSLRLPRARVAVAPGRVAARPKDRRHGLRTDTHQPGGYIVTALMRRLRQIRALFRSHRHRCRKRR